MLGFGPRLDNQLANDQSSECAKASVGRQIDREPRRLRSDRGEEPPKPGQFVLVRFGPGPKGLMAAEVRPEGVPLGPTSH